MPNLNLQAGETKLTVEIRDLIIAGWTGRDRNAVEHHIAELQAIGVPRPRNVPCFYRLGANLLITEPRIDLTGNNSSGEAEFVLLSLRQGLFIAVGSDHTDRKVEAYGVTVSKQMCPKPISAELWSYEDVKDHWDQLLLRSWRTHAGARELYQEGPVSRMLHPSDLINRLTGSDTLPVGTAMFCGTLPVLGQIGGADRFEVELEDPVLRRSLKHSYDARVLPYSD